MRYFVMFLLVQEFHCALAATMSYFCRSLSSGTTYFLQQFGTFSGCMAFDPLLFGG